MEPNPRRAPGAAGTALLAAVDDVTQAGRALADGADLIDVSGCGPDVTAAIRARYPQAVLWPGPAGKAAPGPAAKAAAAGPAALVDADSLAAGPGGDAPAAAVVAVAAIGTWLGAAMIRTRQVRAVRRAIDMTASVAGTRPPALTIRGLA